MTATVCAWCKAHSNMTPVSPPQPLSTAEGARLFGVQAAFRCNHCQKLSIGSTVVSINHGVPGDLAPMWWDKWPNMMWTPETVGGKDFPDVPAHIASAADEAFRCRSISAFRAAILMSRSAIEATCKDKGVVRGQLAVKIDTLAEMALIRPFTQEAAHELRHLGNDMAHGDFVNPVDAEDADAVLNVMSEILNEVYQGPARVNRMRQKRQAAVS